VKKRRKIKSISIFLGCWMERSQIFSSFYIERIKEIWSQSYSSVLREIWIIVRKYFSADIFFFSYNFSLKVSNHSLIHLLFAKWNNCDLFNFLLNSHCLRFSVKSYLNGTLCFKINVVFYSKLFVIRLLFTVHFCFVVKDRLLFF